MDDLKFWAMLPLKKWNDFSGRSRRKEYWSFWLGCLVVSIPLQVIDVAIFKHGALSVLFGLFIFIPTVSVTMRRLHDIGRSGWWLLLLLTGLGSIVIVIFMLLDSQPGRNEYGPNPKGM